MNKIFISGNLTRDPEIRVSGGGKAYARMGIAVQRSSKKSDGTQDVDFFNMTAWGKTAEFCNKYLHKGSRVLVEGRLQTYSYDGKDGVKKTAYDIMIDNIEFASSKSAEFGGGTQSDYRKDEPQNNSVDEFDSGFSGENVSEEDVPF